VTTEPASPVARPVTEDHPDVVKETISVDAPDGYTSDVLLYRPSGPGPNPGIVIGMEATGINHFIRNVGATLAHLGYVTAIPDYYRGAGPTDTENYDDIEAIMPHTFALDFPKAARDLIAAADGLRARDDVDAEQVGYWGYCTGASVALFAACLDRLTAAAVCFYPSQPVFKDLSPKRPASLIDILWLLNCPLLLIYGDNDVVMSVEQLAEVQNRLREWGVDHMVRVYKGAGHAFSAPTPTFHHAEADAASWADAVAYLQSHMPGFAP
jgi:carboxymethylenebutenolidase